MQAARLAELNESTPKSRGENGGQRLKNRSVEKMHGTGKIGRDGAQGKKSGERVKRLTQQALPGRSGSALEGTGG